MRISRIELENVKTVRHGTVSFLGLPSGGSVTGIYGQNGSGKTALVDAVGCFDSLASQGKLPGESASVIRQGEESASVTVTLGENGRDAWEYRFVLSRPSQGSRAVLTGESLKKLSANGAKRLVVSWKREACVQDPDAPAAGEAGLCGTEVAWSPKSYWRSVESLSSETRKLAGGVDASAADGSRSVIFGEGLASLLRAFGRTLEDRAAKGRPVPSAKTTASEKLAKPLLEAVEAVVPFASEKLFVWSALASSMPALGIMLMPEALGNEGKTGSGFFFGGPVAYAADRIEEIRAQIATLNPVLEALVPGLTMEVKELGDEVLEDGSAGVRVEFLSSRNGTKVPLRHESDGIKKLISVLSLLVAAYGDEDASVFIDELDSGVFEFLLGEILQTIASRGRGQLVFTAHNLRPLETLPNQCIVMTTTDEDDRYLRFKGNKATNNLRDQYLRTVLLGGQKHPVYQPTDRARIDAAFWQASAKPEEVLDFETLLGDVDGGADA